MKPRFTYFSIFLALVVVALVLLWTARTRDAGEARIPEILGERFSVLLEQSFPPIETGPESIHRVADELLRTYPYIEEIVVGQEVPNRGLIILYPPGYALDHPEALRDGVSDAYAAIVRSKSDRRPLGTVFFRLDSTMTTAVNVALVCVVGLLAIVAWIGMAEVRSAGLQVRKTKVALEERDRQLIHLERLAMAGRATAALLHDLKKPVINIRDEMANLPPSAVRDALEEETRFFFDLLRDWQLERFVAPDRDVSEYVELSDIIERSLRLASYARERVRVEIHSPVELPDVLGQRQQLVQVFGNLILNAYQAMEGDGTLRIDAKTCVADGTKWIKVELRDTGPGIPPGRSEIIFQPFVTSGRGEHSTGLGLFIVRSIIEGMGGRVWVENARAEKNDRHGAVFCVRLPLPEPEKHG